MAPLRPACPPPSVSSRADATRAAQKAGVRLLHRARTNAGTVFRPDPAHAASSTSHSNLSEEADDSSRLATVTSWWALLSWWALALRGVRQACYGHTRLSGPVCVCVATGTPGIHIRERLAEMLIEVGSGVTCRVVLGSEGWHH
jgi:hypothetical protein